MTCKEKATELVNKYYGLTDVNWGIKEQKKAALICVSEIIDKDGYNNVFWQEVIVEIKKL